MKFKKVMFSLLLILPLLLAGCSEDDKPKEAKEKSEKREVLVEKKEPAPETESEQIKNVVKQQIEFAEAENKEGYLSNLTKNNREDKQGIKDLEDLFFNYDLDYEILSMDEPVKTSPEIATIKVTQKVLAKEVVKNMSFINHIGTFEHTLTLEDGKWRMLQSHVMDIQQLDEQGNIMVTTPDLDKSKEQTEKKAEDKE